MNKHDTLETLKRMRYDLTALQGKLTDVMEAVAQTFPDAEPMLACPHCGSPHRSRMRLEEHVYRQHDDTAVPEHYLAAERAAGYEGVVTGQPFDSESTWPHPDPRGASDLLEYPDAETWDSEESVQARQIAARLAAGERATEDTPTLRTGLLVDQVTPGSMETTWVEDAPAESRVFDTDQAFLASLDDTDSVAASRRRRAVFARARTHPEGGPV